MSNLFEKDIDARFAEFHAENPQVYELFKELAHRRYNAGHRKGSADAIAHVIRWDMELATTGKPYKINDHFPSRYARMLVKECPQFEGFFEFRKRIDVGEAA